MRTMNPYKEFCGIKQQNGLAEYVHMEGLSRSDLPTKCSLMPGIATQGALMLSCSALDSVAVLAVQDLFCGAQQKGGAWRAHRGG